MIDGTEQPRPAPGAEHDSGTVGQADIDAMFGFDEPPAQGPRKGLRAVIESDVINHERMPMLEAVCERLVRTFATSMRNVTSDAIDMHLDGVSSIRFGEFMKRVTLPAMFAVFRIREWENFGIVTVDAGLIYAVVDALLGGRRGGGQQRIEGRPFTSIETRLVSRIVQLALDDFARAFEPIEPITVELERIEMSPRFAAIAGPSNIAAVAAFNVNMDTRGGSFSILLPHATLEPVRERLLQRFMGENPGRDRLWEAHMAAELWRTDVTVDVVLGERRMRLHDVNALKVGETIRLNRGPDDTLEIHCGGIPLGLGHIGQRRSNIAVRIVTDIAKDANQ